jgi:hypothetical protein
MDPLFSKLYYKDGKTMVVLHPPVVFKKHLKTIPPEYKVVSIKSLLISQLSSSSYFLQKKMKL